MKVSSMSSLNLVRVVPLAALLAMGPLVAGGCGAGPAPGPRQAQASEPAREVSVYVRRETMGSREPAIVEAGDAVGYALTSSGYKVGHELKDGDVIAAVRVHAEQERSLVQVKVNGKINVHYKVSLAVSLQDKAGTVLDSATAEYSTSDDGAAQAAAKDMVERFNANNKIGVLALKMQGERAEAERKAKEEKLAEEARKEQEKLEAERAARTKEDAVWKAANAPGCREPQAMDACEAVKKYISVYPKGQYVAEATQVLKEATPKFGPLAIELDWKASGSEACKAPTTSTDCDAVSRHLSNHASSPHADEARAMLKKSEKKIAALARQEKAREAAEEARQKREEAKENAEARRDCIANCRDPEGFCSMATAARKPYCLQRCINMCH